MIRFITKKFQHQIQKSLGVSEPLHDLEQRLHTLENEVAGLKAMTRDCERNLFFLCPGSMMEEFERELMRLESIFDLGSDSNTGVPASFRLGPPEFIKISNEHIINGN